MKQPLLQLFQSLFENLRDMAPIILVIDFFQLVILQRPILEVVERTGHFEDRAGSGIAFQIDIEDAVGVSHQIRELTDKVRDEL